MSRKRRAMSLSDWVGSYNAPHIKRLITILKNKNVVGLVGAGTSVASGYPGWHEFLERLTNPLRPIVTARYLRQLRLRDPRTRLDDISRFLGSEYSLLFRDTFGPRQKRNVPWINLLFDLNLAFLITTNYTVELETVARAHPARPLGIDPHAIRWFDVEFPDVLRRTSDWKGIVYLHGRWDDSPELRLNERGRKWSEIILGEHSYKYAYEYPGEIAKALEAVCRLHTLFIVGASLNDSDVTGVLRAVRATSGDRAIPNYVVLPIENSNTGLRIAVECLERFGLQPIFYAISRNNGRGDHSALEHLLRHIAAKVSTARRIRVVRGTPFTEPKTKTRMLWIPKGQFHFGKGRRSPAPMVRLSGFWISELPITNKQFATFLAERNYQAPTFWTDNRSNEPEQPVAGVSWHDAKAFCTWLKETTRLNWDLPSEVQWEYAARGEDERTYPWGNEKPSQRLACYGRNPGTGRPELAGIYVHGRGPFGTLDQAGNVWEWCVDHWQEKPHLQWVSSQPLNPVTKSADRDWRVLRGGSWADPPTLLEAAIRYQRAATYSSRRVGFRVVVNTRPEADSGGD